MRYKYLHNGFTLIEIIIFIVVMGLIGTTILSSMNVVLRGMSKLKNQIIANQIAVSGIEWFLGQRYSKGFNINELGIIDYQGKCNIDTKITSAVFTDLNVPGGYDVFVKCSTQWMDCNGKYITVSVTGLGSAKLSICFADY